MNVRISFVNTGALKTLLRPRKDERKREERRRNGCLCVCPVSLSLSHCIRFVYSSILALIFVVYLRDFSVFAFYLSPSVLVLCLRACVCVRIYIYIYIYVCVLSTSISYYVSFSAAADLFCRF